MDIEHIVKWHDWLYVVNWKGLWRICYGLIVRGVSGKYRYVTCRLIGKLFMLITATLLSTLILYHAHLTLVEPALFEWDVFEMAAPIQVPPNARCFLSYDFSMQKVNVHILDHPPYSPDLAPSDFHLFLHLKKHLAGKKFDDDDEVHKEVMTWFKGQAADFYDSGIQKLVPRLNKCLDNVSDYVEK